MANSIAVTLERNNMEIQVEIIGTGPRGIQGVSAYEQAVRGGYPGTETQFNTDLAGFKAKAAETASSAQAAANARDSAITAKDYAEDARDVAAGAASDADDARAAAQSAQTAAETAQGKAEDAQEAAETAQGKAEDAQEAAEQAAQSIASSASQIAANTADIVDLKSRTNEQEAKILAAFPTDTAFGAAISFSDGADDIPVKTMTVGIEPVQDLNGYDAPWPAGGGANLFDISALTPQASTLSFSDNKVTITAWTTKGYNGAIYDASQLVGGGNYYLSFHALRSSGSMNNIAIVGSYVLDGVTYNAIQGNRAYVDNEITATDLIVNFPSGATSARFAFYINNSVTVIDGMNGYFENIILSKSPNQTWTPYSNICPISGWDEANVWVQPTHDATTDPTATIQLGQTVYGGTLDVVSGKLTVDRAKANLYGANITVSRVSTQVSGKYRFQIYGITEMQEPETTGTVTTALSNVYQAISADVGYQAAETGFAVRNSYSIHIFDEEHATDTADDFKTYLESIGAYIVYPLATPIIVQLTPVEVKTLLGINCIWAETGDTELTYRADPTLYIERKIAAAMAAASEA